MISSHTIELLAPARDVEVARAAILAGADAIYIGAPSHGARSQAGNSLEDLAQLTAYTHAFGVKIYVTVNTLIYNSELAQVQQLIQDLYRIGVDALIIQDLGILEMKIPPIELHASTQCDIRDAAKARALVEAGLKRVVVARELGVKQIAAIQDAIQPLGGEIEAFCHGALCVSYSGACKAGFMISGRSGNRGECSQICRWKYDLENQSGEKIVRGRYLLSLQDMCRIDSLGRMIDAGVSSFKIEGRLKDREYVINAVQAYRKALDKEMKKRGLARSSFGQSRVGFEPDLDKCFNRGFTPYFFDAGSDTPSVASHLTPGFRGEKIGEILSVNKNQITLKTSTDLHNGDGLTVLNPELTGFRVNRAERKLIYLKDAIPGLKPGLALYRNYEKAFNDKLLTECQRTLALKMVLRLAGTRLCLDLADERGAQVTVTTELTEISQAVTPQARPRRKLLQRTGDTIFRVSEVSDLLENIFVPASTIASLRRKGIERLQQGWNIIRPLNLRKPIIEIHKTGDGLTAENVANDLARNFYETHGYKEIIEAIETQPRVNEPVRIMTCKYCLRREFGQCLKKGAKPEDWYLNAQGLKKGRLKLEFDCKNCQMHVIYGTK